MTTTTASIGLTFTTVPSREVTSMKATSTATPGGEMSLADALDADYDFWASESLALAEEAWESARAAWPEY